MVHITRLFVLTCLFLGVQCDYKCVCNYHVQRSVYGSASNYNVPIGFLFEFDCGATLPHIHVGKDWAAIIYNNRIGYIKVDQGVHLETCSGPQPTLAISQTLPTTSIPPQPSSSQSTTLTSTLSTSTQTIKPSTILSTTLMPTTTVTTMKPSTQRRTPHAYATPKIPQTTSLAAPLAPHIFHGCSYISDTRNGTALVYPCLATIAFVKPTTYGHYNPVTNKPITNPTQATTHHQGAPDICAAAVKGFTYYTHGILGHHSNKCYELVNTQLNFEAGETYCRQRGGHLAQISNRVEQAYVKAFLTRNSPTDAVIIGLNDIKSEGVFVWTTGSTLSSPYTGIYSNWNPRTSHNVDKDDCVVFNWKFGGYWENVPCFYRNTYWNGIPVTQQSTYPVLCQYVVAYTLKPTTPLHYNPATQATAHNQGNNLGCAHSQGHYGYNCYELVQVPLPFSQAEVYCKLRRGHLARINNHAEQSYIQSYLTTNARSYPVLIGYNDYYMVGVFRWTLANSAGSYYASYTNWNYRSYQQHHCAAMNLREGGLWDNVPCGNRYLFLCQYSAHTMGGGIPSLIG